MAGGVTIDGDLHVMGRLSSGQFSAPAGSISDAAIAAAPATLVGATKTVRRDRALHSAEVSVTTATKRHILHVANASGTVRRFFAGLAVANAGAATVTFDLLKNGTTILTGVISVDNGDAAYAVVAGTLDGALDDYVIDDVFEVNIVATAGGGTVGKGEFAEMVFDENPS